MTEQITWFYTSQVLWWKMSWLGMWLRRWRKWTSGAITSTPTCSIAQRTMTTTSYLMSVGVLINNSIIKYERDIREKKNYINQTKSDFLWRYLWCTGLIIHVRCNNLIIRTDRTWYMVHLKTPSTFYVDRTVV